MKTALFDLDPQASAAAADLDHAFLIPSS